MRKTIFLIGIIIVAATVVNWTDACTEVKTDVEAFGQNLTYADMYEYRDPDYGFVLRYPSFFSRQSDSLNAGKGSVRFSYNDQWTTVVLEGYVMDNHQVQSLKSAADSLARVLHATDTRLGKDCFILAGPQYENGSPLKGYSYYSKFVCNYKCWFVCTMVYPDRYRTVLSRLFNEIDNWQIWGRTRLELKQGESQTPRAKSRKTPSS